MPRISEVRMCLLYEHLSNLPEGRSRDLIYPEIVKFMKSTNFLTCMWVQSQYAPYLLARYSGDTAKVSTWTINHPNDIYSDPWNSKKIYFADPFPEWFPEHTHDAAILVRACHL